MKFKDSVILLSLFTLAGAAAAYSSNLGRNAGTALPKPSKQKQRLINLDLEQTRELKRREGGGIVKFVSDLIAGGAEFPFYKYCMEFPEHKFRALQTTKSDKIRRAAPAKHADYQRCSQMRGSIIDFYKAAILELPVLRDFKYPSFADFFTEEQRITGHKRGLPPFIDLWRDRGLHHAWLPEFLRRDFPLEPYAMRENGLYWCNKMKYLELTSFGSQVMSAMIDAFNAKRIFDPSTGWGDRLAGALARQDKIVCYHGTDPNEKLQPGYRQMIEKLAARKNIDKFKMFTQPAEDFRFVPPFCDYDLIFTSPPYFDFEIYQDDNPNQSTTNYPQLHAWTVNFLFKMLKNCSRALVTGGYIALNIEQPRQHAAYNYVEQMILYSYTIDDLKFHGVIFFTTDKVPRPIYVFKKTEPGKAHSQ